MNKEQVKLQEHIYNNLLVNSLMALIFVGIISMVIYFVSVSVSEGMISNILLENSIDKIQDNIIKEAAIMEAKIAGVERTMSVFQAEESLFFTSLSQRAVPETDLFAYHESGVFYKLYDNGGSSLYYSSDTKIGEEELKKAFYTETFDEGYKRTVEENPLIAQIYINTFDNMNRIYPFMDDVAQQFGPTVRVTDYNFYYLADEEHNPERKPVWTKAYLDPAGLGWTVSCVVPIYNNDFLEGVTGVDITIDILISHIITLDLMPVKGILVVDPQGDIIAMNKDVEKLFNLSELSDNIERDSTDVNIYKPDIYDLNHMIIDGKKPLEEMTEQEVSHYAFSDQGKRYHIIKNRLESTQWDLYAIIDEDLATGDIEQVSDILRRMLIYQVVLVLVLLMVYSFWLNVKAKEVSRTISVPIEKLSKAISLMGKGEREFELDEDVDIYEINDLNKRFIQMNEQLSARTSALIKEESEKKIQERLKEKYKKQATIDGLTKLYNRKKIDDLLNEEILKAEREAQPLTIILLDIDDFKLVNDRHGHLTGDKVLKEFAHILKSNIRGSDLAGRWGGEEFLLICPNTSSDHGVVLAEKLREIIEDHNFDISHKITASFGVSEWKGKDRRSFFGGVDLAVYEAKNRSKNIVVNYDEIIKD